jgi:PAS domain S-box-containing protein
MLGVGSAIFLAGLATAWNLTLRRKVRLRTQELARSERQFRALTVNSPDAILRLSLEGRVLFANDASAALLGLEPAQVFSKKLYELGLGQEWAENWQRNIEMVIRTGEALDTEMTGSNGRAFSGRWFPEPDETGRALHALVVWRDVTERKGVEEERRRIETQLYDAQRWESLGVLAGSVAHDFNNHLAAILGQAEVGLLDEGAGARASLQNIRETARTAADLCRQLSAFSRRGSEALAVIDVSGLIAEMAALLAATLPRGVDLQIACEAELPPIEADSGQIRQLLVNMMLNAASLLSGRSGVVLLRATEIELQAPMLALREDSKGLAPGPFVLVEVSDNGAGLDEAGLQQLFQPFFAPDATGKGLGLAVARAIAVGHRGFLHASSTLGEGTTVQAFLPATSRPAPVADATAPSPLAGQGKVLLVDDDPMVLNATSRLLEKIGLTPVSASDGVQGMEKFLIHRDEIACVILDLNMPYMNGAETLKNLRASGCNCPVIVASGFSQLLITQEMRALGIAAFLEKPYTFEILARTLERVMAEERPAS